MNALYRMLDAQLNRAAEGLRVLEDYARFSGDRFSEAKELRELRHGLRRLFKADEPLLLAARQSESDVGALISARSQSDRRTSEKDLVAANFKRAQEALRGVEETAKALGRYESGKAAETLRFSLYTLHRNWEAGQPPALPKGLYAITDERFSGGRDAVFQAKELCKAGVPVIQYREKYAEMRYRYETAKEIRRITADYGVLLIIDDHADLARAVDADGVHVGQDDLPPTEVRRLLGPNKIIGLSTHSPEQWKEACSLPVDYAGVGPLFETHTKEHVCAPVGLTYLETVVRANAAAETPLPFVAIGGIKASNIDSVLQRGAQTVCLVTGIIGEDDIYAAAKRLHQKIIMSSESRRLSSEKSGL